MKITTEHDYIEKSKKLIEKSVGWADSSEWKNRDFEYLSELIFKKTRVSISVSTLKRIWQNDRKRIPQVTTLNALATFIDYENWNDLKTKLKDEIKPSKNNRNSVTVRKRTWFVSLIIILTGVIIFGIVLYQLKKRYDKKLISAASFNEEDVVFTSKKTVTSGVPNTVVFKYDISKVKFDSAFIQQDWDKRRRTRIFPEKHYHTAVYYYPGYYVAKLVLNDQVIKEFPLLITTDGWIALYKKNYMQEIPVYLKNIDPVKNGRLYISVEDLETNKIANDKDYFIGFYNAADYGEVYSDNFGFETLVRNDPAEGGLTCQYAAITLQCQDGVIITSFSDPGCTSNLALAAGNIFLNGSDNDLSVFGIDLTGWRKIRYNVVNRNIIIRVDNKEIYQLTFKRHMGKIIGISYNFYGCGSVKEVRLYDENEYPAYEENFE